MNAFGYSDAVWDRFGQPAHAGRLEPGPGVFSARAGTAAARSLLELSLRVQGGMIEQARFRAYGCPSAIAVGEWLAEQLAGKAVEALRANPWNAAAIRQALNLAEDRAHCALMGEDVLSALLKQM
jgi:NifU-like protein involved in Fe-S cluster formation